MELKNIEQQVFARWELAAQEVSLALSQRLVVAFLGSASAGKDSAIRALFGLDFGEVDPIPGSTERIRVAALDAGGQVLIVNAPGFGDLRDAVESDARSALEHLDIAVYVMNCDGGATIDERRDLDSIRALGRPTLVCLNKIDLIRKERRRDFVDRTLLQLGVESSDAVVTAFDPMAQERTIGVKKTIRWIHGQLADHGKSLLFAKHLRNRRAACEAIIHAAAKRAALAGAIPIPGADATAVTAIQVKLISDIAAVYGKRIDRDFILFILGEVLAGTSKGFVRWGVNALKLAGWIPGTQLAHLATSALGASIAGGTTVGVGRAATLFIERDGEVSGSELREIFDASAFDYAQIASESEPPDA